MKVNLMQTFSRATLPTYKLITIFLSLLLMQACSDTQNTTSKPNIINGTVIETKGLAVAALLKPDTFSDDLYVHCSGVLITQNILLTAAHCVSTSESISREVTPYLPDELFVQVGELVAEPVRSKSLAVATIIIHPKYNPSAMGRDNEGLIKPSLAYDLAIIKLAKPFIDKQLSPIEIMTEDEKAKWLSSEKQAHIFGYGLSDLWSTSDRAPRLRGATTIYRPSFTKTVRRQEVVNGRLITRPVKIDISGSSEIEIFLGGSGYPDTCGGDSGGPAFSKADDGTFTLIGITSRGDPECDDGGIYTNVSSLHDWIFKEIENLTP
jgi:secreted trypsin-like serine protease